VLASNPERCSIFFMSRAARSISLPITMQVLDATVGPLFGTTAVSGVTISTWSSERDRVSAAICVNIVFVPCPISVAEVRIRTCPFAVASTPAMEAR